MNVSRRLLVDLLVQLGVDTARDWDVQTLQDKINTNGILYYAPEDNKTLFNSLPSELSNLVGGIVKCRSDGGTVTVVEELEESQLNQVEINDPAEPEPKPGPSPPPRPKPIRRKISQKKGRPKKSRTKKKTHNRDGSRVCTARDPELSWHDKLKEWERKPVALTERGIGVTRCVVDELRKAGSDGKPISKDSLLKVLKRKFPGRPIDKMQRTISNLLGSRLEQQYGIAVRKTRHYEVDGKRGYWIVCRSAKKKKKQQR